MALATVVDVEAQLGRPLTDVELTRIDALLGNVSDLVEGYCNREFVAGDVPEKVARTTAKIVARTLTASADLVGVERESVGPFSIGFNQNTTSGDAYLTSADRKALRFHRANGGLSSVSFVTDREF